MASLRSACALIISGIALGAMPACAPLLPPATEVSRPAPAPAPGRPAAVAPTPESEAIRAYFASQQASLQARGLLRTDGGGADTPFTRSMLEQNFVRIALFDEYTEIAGRLVSRPTPSRLRRWDVPVRMRLEFATDLPAAQRSKDTSDVRDYAERLSRLTSHPIGLVEGASSANFHILVLDETTRRGYAERLRELVPGIDDLSLRTITEMPRSASCLVLAFARGGTSTYTQAVAVVRAELPDLTRLSCFHEELAQGLGLPNDSSLARPSIFNDTEEFATLTTHDEMLLRILYDPRLSPGMAEAEARPIVRRIASELLGGEG